MRPTRDSETEQILCQDMKFASDVNPDELVPNHTSSPSDVSPSILSTQASRLQPFYLHRQDYLISPIPDQRHYPHLLIHFHLRFEPQSPLKHDFTRPLDECIQRPLTNNPTNVVGMADNLPSPAKPQESMTTREEMDFDDNDHEQETGRVSPLGHETIDTHNRPTSPRRKVSFQDGHQEIPLSSENPPAKPPRPTSAQQQAEHTLIEAFPSIDAKVVKAVLSASGGKVEPAFNALLGMTDPESLADEPAAPPPPPKSAMKPMSQVEADEMYARQLAEEYNNYPSRHAYNQREPTRRGPNQQHQTPEEERSFFDDDLPEISRNIQQGFQETQKRFNSWFTTLKKKMDGEDEEDLYESSQAGSRQNTAQWQGRQNFGPSQTEQLHGIRKSAEAQRRSTEAQRYDADPHELGDDEFERLELRDDEQPPPMPPRTSSRPQANPDLFKPQPKPPQSGPVDEVDAVERKNGGPDAAKGKKWQPLTSVAPDPQEDNDPFSVGDDEDESKDKTEDLRKDDSERLKSAARNSVSVQGDQPLQEIERAGSQGTRNKEAEELLTGKK